MEAVTLHHYLREVHPYLDRYGYGAVFVTVFMEGFGVPAPGQTMIMAGGLLASRGQMDIGLLLLVAWGAAVIGDNIGFAIGHYGGRRLVLRQGSRIGVRQARLQRVEGFFRSYGGIVVVLARFFDVLRQLNGVVAGTMGMHWWRFLIYNALGGTLWVGAWGLGMYIAGQHMEQLLNLFRRFEPYVAAAGMVALLLTLVYLLMRSFGGTTT
jgi:membrane protein DedA with SNARE-associated domain